MKQQSPELRRRRAEILEEYRFYGVTPIRIGGEPISMELALQLELLIETPRSDPTPQRQEAS
jgi:hypothetical protein